jgi:hypothetical protein
VEQTLNRQRRELENIDAEVERINNQRREYHARIQDLTVSCLFYDRYYN